MKAIYATLQEINGQYQYLTTKEVNDIPSSIINEYNKYINKYRVKPLPNVVKLTDYVFIESEYDKKNKIIKGYYICNESFTLLTIDELISKSNTIITKLFKKYSNPVNDTQMDYYFSIIKKIIMTNHISFITKTYPTKRKETLFDPLEMWVENKETSIYIDYYETTPKDNNDDAVNDDFDIDYDWKDIEYGVADSHNQSDNNEELNNYIEYDEGKDGELPEYYEGDINLDNLDNYERFERNKDKIIEILNNDDYIKNKVNNICDLLKINEKHRKYLLEKGNKGNRMKPQRFLKKIEKYIGKV